MRLQWPINFSEIGSGSTSAQQLGVDSLDDLMIVPSKPSPIYAPHDAILSDRPVSKDVLLLSPDKKFGSLLYEFILDPKFIGAKEVKVKKGEVIGASAVAPGLFKWTGLLPKASTKEADDFVGVHPLILAGALGGIEYPGIANATGYVDDVKKGLAKLTTSIGTHAAAFAIGWLVGKK